MTTDSFYKRALLEVGQYGKFQKKFDCLYNILLSVLWCMAYNNIILALTVIPHTCKPPQKQENFSLLTGKYKDIPPFNQFNETIELSSCFITYITTPNNNKTTECNEYTYDNTWYGSTVTSQNNWVCNNEIYMDNVLAYSKIGETIGSLFFGWFGDTYGRKPSYIISLSLLITGRAISLITSHSYTFFVTGCIIAAFPSTFALQSISLISIEISSPKRRSQIAKYRLIASSFGMCLMPLLYWWLRDWKTFLIVTTVTQLPYLIFSWKIIESPEWLWVNKKPKKCIRQLRHIARVNNASLEKDTENKILSESHTTGNEEALGPLELFSSRRLAINTFLQLCLWVSVTVSYIVSLLSSGEKSDGNPFLEFTWQALIEVPAHFSAAWLVEQLGRRYTSAASSGFTCILWMILGLRELDVFSWLNQGYIGTIIGIVNRFSITIAYYTINLLNMELYPTRLRQSGMSLGNIVSGGAAAVAPYILYVVCKLSS
ncbi:hypothetical protein O3G_MSEX002443 [Manduca sexta]|uniref:Uncharacterized protein n=3 Tax=Manduca sexta TaxID=7130 RepID=A0A921YNJ2_MANSE|nr:hypothetical protein O3G_MSEX002443 [Manduca sexta]